MWKNGVGSASLGDEDEGCGWGANIEALLTILHTLYPGNYNISYGGPDFVGVSWARHRHAGLPPLLCIRFLRRVSAAAALRVFPENSLCR